VHWLQYVSAPLQLSYHVTTQVTHLLNLIWTRLSSAHAAICLFGKAPLHLLCASVPVLLELWSSCFGEIMFIIFEKYWSGFFRDGQLPHCRQQRPSGPTSYGSDQVIPLQTSTQSADRSLPPGISQFRRRVPTSSICENNPFRTLTAVSNLQPFPHEII